ncbi:MAG: hypothetical protein ACKON9_08565, partial [Planctomycetaceae bacterium]
GFDVLEMLTLEDRPLQVALGDEEVLDDAAFVETADDLNSTSLQSPSTLEQMAKQLQQAENAWLRSTAEDAFAAMTGQQDPAEDASDLGGLLKIPVDGLAVTKGSFTAFTIPAAPQPRQSYSIVIEVKLPDDVKKYRVSDLSGKVRGTDGYEQKLPYDTRTPGAAGYPVPGGSIRRLESSTSSSPRAACSGRSSKVSISSTSKPNSGSSTSAIAHIARWKVIEEYRLTAAADDSKTTSGPDCWSSADGSTDVV